MDKDEIYKILNQAYFSNDPHEKAVIEHLPALLRDNSLIVDVGASLGQYTRAISKAVRHSEIVAIEADPVRVEQLTRNCEVWTHESTNSVVALHLAVTDRAGEISYFVTNSDVSGGLAQHVTPKPVDWEEISVPCTSLDQLFEGRVPDFVKIDVEGAELSVLRGAQRILDHGSAIFLIELHDWPDGKQATMPLISLMQRAGYRRASFYGQPIFVRSRVLWFRLTVMAIGRRLLLALQRRMGQRRAA